MGPKRRKGKISLEPFSEPDDRPAPRRRLSGKQARPLDPGSSSSSSLQAVPVGERESVLEETIAASGHIAPNPIEESGLGAQEATGAKSRKSRRDKSDSSDSSTSDSSKSPRRDGGTGADVESEHLFRRQFLGTWSHTELPGLKKPSEMSKEEFGHLVLELSVKASGMPCPQRVQGGNRLRTYRILKLCVVDERHQSGEVHKHFPILADKPFRAGRLQSLLQEKGIAVRFSDTHDYYWTTFLYVTVPRHLPN